MVAVPFQLSVDIHGLPWTAELVERISAAFLAGHPWHALVGRAELGLSLGVRPSYPDASTFFCVACVNSVGPSVPRSVLPTSQWQADDARRTQAIRKHLNQGHIPDKDESGPQETD
jgi:hypothetical protein